MTAPEGDTVTEPWPLPHIWRLLPADISDAEYMRVCDEMTQEIRDMGGNPAYMGVTPLDDGRWLAQAWQPQTEWDYTYPPVDAANFQ